MKKFYNIDTKTSASFSGTSVVEICVASSSAAGDSVVVVVVVSDAVSVDAMIIHLCARRKGMLKSTNLVSLPSEISG